MSTLNYIVNSEGKRELDNESKVRMQIEYLSLHDLYPFSMSKSSVSSLGFILKDNIKNIKEPYIIMCSKDYSREVFSNILMYINHIEGSSSYVSYDVKDVSYLVQQYLSGEFHDLSLEFISTKVLFIRMYNTEIPHMYNSYSILNLARGRSSRGQYTFFFFEGTKSDLAQDKWKIDVNGDGKMSSGTRLLEPITNYINVIDLNKEMK